MSSPLPPGVSRTLLEIQDPRVLATADISLVLSCLMLILSIAQFRKRNTYFYAGIVSAAVPLVVADAWTLLAADRLVSTNSYLVVRIMCPLFSTSQVCGLSIIRFRVLSSTDQIRWFTRRVSNCLLTLVYGEMLVSILLLTVSYFHQANQHYFTSHPWRTPVVMGHMALTSVLDFALAAFTFRIVWTIRASALERRLATVGGGFGSSGPSDEGTFSMGITSAPPPTPSVEMARSGDIPNSSTFALVLKQDALSKPRHYFESHPPVLHPLHEGSEMSTAAVSQPPHNLPPTVPCDKPFRLPALSGAHAVENSIPSHPPTGPKSPYSQSTHTSVVATGLIKLSKSVHSLGSIASFTSTTARSAVRSVKKQKTARLRRVTSQLLMALTAMIIGVVGGLGTFGLSSGNMFGDNIAGLFIRIYLLPATICWTLLVELTKATRM